MPTPHFPPYLKPPQLSNPRTQLNRAKRKTQTIHQSPENKSYPQLQVTMSSQCPRPFSGAANQYADYWNVSGWYCCQVSDLTLPPSRKQANITQCKFFNTSLEEYCDHYLDPNGSGVERLCAHDCCAHCKLAGEQPITAKVYRSLGNKKSTTTYIPKSGQESSKGVTYGGYGMGY